MNKRALLWVTVVGLVLIALVGIAAQFHAQYLPVRVFVAF